MLNIADIEISSLSLSDPYGRLFFADGRVFRLINAGYVDVCKDFLVSDCYKELCKRQWIVNTWIPTDVKVDGYDLVVEHEKLVCVPPRFWPYSQLRDTAEFLIQLNEVCRNYGYSLKDAQFSNVTFVNNTPVFLDLGSILPGKNNFNNDCFYSLICVPLLYKSIGQELIFEALIESAWKHVSNKIVPSGNEGIHWLPDNILIPVVNSYDCYIKNKWHHYHISSPFVVGFISSLNKYSNILFGKDVIKLRLYFEEDINKQLSQVPKRPNWHNENTYFPLEDDTILAEATKIINAKSENKLTILIYGNFPLQAIEEFSKNFNCEIVVASNDKIYIDQLYQYAKNHHLRIHIMQYNLMMEPLQYIIKGKKLDYLIINNAIDNLLSSSRWQAEPLYKLLESVCNWLITRCLPPPPHTQQNSHAQVPNVECEHHRIQAVEPVQLRKFYVSK